MKVFALLLFALLAACAAGTMARRQPIAIITVSADLDALPAGAPLYWNRLGIDLQTELARRLVGDISSDGGVLLVDIDEASLADAWRSGFAGDRAGLSALVTLTSVDGAVLVRQPVTVATSAAEGGTSVAAGSSEYYAGLLRAFAARVEAAINPLAPGS